MSIKDGSVAPKERINVRYVPKTDGQTAEIELPLNLLITGDMTGRSEETPIDERIPVSINKNNFNSVLSEAGVSLNFNVPSHLVDKPGEEMNVALEMKSLDDFSPDNIARKVPEMKKLLELREALVALKGPLGNLPKFRSQLQSLLENEDTRAQLLKELELINK
ncbi:type VI secretion system contractile sheath small subunit [Salmonella enterica]|nr:type VI secretion system contractile sheath small subunit [Salmonella enterica]ECI4153134.1 type VI secretion system contractile sheath small subunit [Salmonella enterica subsp. salamae]HCM1853066.1 type VI secretion system contractile sheath small subunit [Salmonella enterica subsp. salamae serovar 42:z29:-]EAU0241702.1 type VI secretion system contractile sheath small subunit [Salmonella enterica]EAX3604106.1 type VI secretion system contractile sheath small subunit [Salmonella enterica]